MLAHAVNRTSADRPRSCQSGAAYRVRSEEKPPTQATASSLNLRYLSACSGSSRSGSVASKSAGDIVRRCAAAPPIDQPGRRRPTAESHQVNRPPDDGRAAAVLPLPERAADDRGARAAPALVVGGAEHAASRGRDAEHLEEAAADEHSLRVSDLAAPGQVETRRRPRQQARKRLLVGAEPFPLRVGQLRVPGDDVAGPRARIVKPHLDELARILHGERAETHGVEQLEDRGVGADAERQRERGHRREPR